MQKRARMRNKSTAGLPYYGTTLHSLRVGSGFTQEDLADKIGISPGYVALVENGHRIPSLPILTSWLETTGQSLDVRPDLVSDLAEHSKAARKRSDYELLAEKLSVNSERIAIGTATDDLVQIVHRDLAGISTAKLSKQAIEAMRACVTTLAQKLRQGG